MHRQVSKVKVVLGKVLPGRRGRRSSQCQDPPRRGCPSQAKPRDTPQRLLLHVVHILQRPERGTVNHMAETHAQSVSKTSRGGEEKEGRATETRGYKKCKNRVL